MRLLALAVCAALAAGATLSNLRLPVDEAGDELVTGEATPSLGRCVYRTNHSVVAYSTADFASWRRHGVVLAEAARAPGVEFRPNVIRHAASGAFLMWYEDRHENQTGYAVAVADGPAGPFRTVVNDTAMQGRGRVGDFSLFVDDDGAAYHVRTGFVVERLADDYRSGAGPYAEFASPKPAEAPVMFKERGTYYVVGIRLAAAERALVRDVFSADAPLGNWTPAATSARAPAPSTPTAPTTTSRTPRLRRVRRRHPAYLATRRPLASPTPGGRPPWSPSSRPPGAAAAAHGRSCAPAAPRFDAAAACGPGVSGVVVVPAVRKGLNNQRMRIVQDAVVASLLGAALELPRSVRTRRGCGYRADCYANYSEEVAFGDVFDEARVVAGLRTAGVCVVRTGLPADAALPELAGSLWPAAASMLEREFGAGPVAGPSHPALQRWKVAGHVFSLGGDGDCCTKLVPDTPRSARLVRLVNAAFAPAARTG
ncbi:hypothetical protein JL721_12699 [Aureococcus anophagefferens]|nr:hypothetical protein JL721_12699 [Aureococcus anophagefferens]